MERYRPPPPRSSKYITAAGAARLRAELDALWRVERPQVTLAVQAAAAQGDRSENAEYTYGKRRLREIDRRVRHLRKRLEGMTIVDQPPSDPRRVFSGARVTRWGYRKTRSSSSTWDCWRRTRAWICCCAPCRCWTRNWAPIYW